MALSKNDRSFVISLALIFLLLLAASIATIALSNAAKEHEPRGASDDACACNKSTVVAEALPFVDTMSYSFLFPYYSNVGSVLNRHSSIREAVIVCHGATRVANSYFCAVQGSLCNAQNLGVVEKGTVAVFAPHFVFPEDSKPEGSLVWSNEDKDGVWRYGQDTQGGSSGVNVSSYDVMDRFMEILADRTLYPNLERITVAGHSSGGQLVNRYALVHHNDQSKSSSLPRVRFVVANPSSYAYLNASRWVQDASPPQLSVPDATDCPNYNTWYFGLKLDGNSPRYIKETDMQAAVERYQHLDVVYLLGTADKCNPALTPGCISHGLETTCADMLQGQQRLQRGTQYADFVNAFYGKPTHKTVFVPDVEHSHVDMFQSAEGVTVLFT